MTRYNNEKQQEKLGRLLGELERNIEIPLGPEPQLHISTRHGDDARAALADDWSRWDPVDENTVWGAPGSNTWFACRIAELPEAPQGRIIARVDTEYTQICGRRDPQIQVWLDGAHYQAVNGYHREIDIPTDCCGPDGCVLHMKAYKSEAAAKAGIRLDLRIIDEAAEKLFFDLQVPFEVACRLRDTDARKYAILELVDRALRKLDFRNRHSESFRASIPAAAEIAAEIYALRDTEKKPTVVCTGHTHIDVAWLWTVAQTREKTVRSFSTALDLMDRFPDLVFMYNQCVLFDYLKQDAPDLFARVLDKVKNGQLEIEGAMWLEPDMNIINGESMVRHLLYGSAFHQREFGVRPKVVWLPDTFGYSAAMPQVLAKAGIEFFVTSKVSWNDTNRMPYDTFFWTGIDGTPIKSYLITTQPEEADEIGTVYQLDLDVSHVMGAWKRYEPKAINREIMLCYGHGDGGGGVTREMIERARRMERGIPGCPNVKLEGVGPFFDRLGARMEAEGASYPSWHGELYLEYHRGTLTSMARNKRHNRRAEDALRAAELLAVHAMLRRGEGAYGGEDLRRFWNVVMLNQFHDILPGTSIREVYEVSEREYGELFAQTGAFRAARSAQVFGALRPGEAVVENPLGWERKRELALIDAPETEGALALRIGGETVVAQPIHRADGRRQHIAPLPAVPPLGGVTLRLEPAQAPAPVSSLRVEKTLLENALIRVRLDGAGRLTSVFDKRRDRELLAPGQPANRLAVYEDKPVQWDAWDIDWYYEEKCWEIDAPTSIEVVETGPHRAALRIEHAYQSSKIVQVVSLAEGSTTVEFDTFVDWREHQSLLKTGFDFDLNTAEVAAEIQFGHVVRNTHRNTSWDEAKFEASMHRWIDLSEPDFGAALLNDCKYGYDARGTSVRLTLIKSGIWPNEQADIGEHRFRYALSLHHGRFGPDNIPRRAEAFSAPLRVAFDGIAGADAPPHVTNPVSLARVDCDNICIQSVKKAEKSGHVVLRLYDTMNIRSRPRLTFCAPVAEAHIVDLLEENPAPARLVAPDTVELDVRPHEILTLRLRLDMNTPTTSKDTDHA